MATNRDMLVAAGYSASEVDQIVQLADGEARLKLEKAGISEPSEAQMNQVIIPIVMLAATLGNVRRTHNTKFVDILYILGEKGKE